MNSSRVVAALAVGLMLAGCGDKVPIVTSINTLCVETTRFHTTEAQRAAFAADETTWESLVRWLVAFNKIRDAECLKPGKGL